MKEKSLACGPVSVHRDDLAEHRPTKPYHLWTNGRAERMSRTVKDATVKAFHYDNLEGIKAHVRRS
jgi:hypothetical protein